MKKLVPLAICALIMSPVAAMAADSDAPQKEATKKDPADRWVCKVERMTGSLTRSKRTCMKASEWDKLASETAMSVNKFVNDSNRPDRVPLNAQAANGFQ